MKFLRLYNRIVMALLLIGFAVLFTSFIGEKTSCDPISWQGAWRGILVIATCMFAGFMAGRESKEPS